MEEAGACGAVLPLALVSWPVGWLASGTDRGRGEGMQTLSTSVWRFLETL